jgi:hypothetical protein
MLSSLSESSGLWMLSSCVRMSPTTFSASWMLLMVFLTLAMLVMAAPEMPIVAAVMLRGSVVLCADQWDVQHAVREQLSLGLLEVR